MLAGTWPMTPTGYFSTDKGGGWVLALPPRGTLAALDPLD